MKYKVSDAAQIWAPTFFFPLLYCALEFMFESIDVRGMSVDERMMRPYRILFLKTVSRSIALLKKERKKKHDRIRGFVAEHLRGFVEK